MADNAGYILLHRCLLDSSCWNDGEKHNKKSAWIDLLLKVNHADKKIMVDGKELTIHRGQRLTSIAKLSIEWGVTRKTAKKWIDSWKNAEMVYVDSTTRYTLITILKYSIYQDGKTSRVKGVPNSLPNSVSKCVPNSVSSSVPTNKECKRMINNDKELKEKRRHPLPEEIEPPRGGGEWQ